MDPRPQLIHLKDNLRGALLHTGIVCLRYGGVYPCLRTGRELRERLDTRVRVPRPGRLPAGAVPLVAVRSLGLAVRLRNDLCVLCGHFRRIRARLLQNKRAGVSPAFHAGTAPGYPADAVSGARRRDSALLANTLRIQVNPGQSPADL